MSREDATITHLRKVKSKQSLVRRGRSTASEVTYVRLGQFVVRKIRAREIIRPEAVHHPREVVLNVCQGLERHQYRRLALRVVAVREFGDVPRPDLCVHGTEGPGSFGDGHHERTLGVVGPLGDHPQPIEVHVRAGGYGDEGRTGDVVLLDVFFQASDREGPRGLEDDAPGARNANDDDNNNNAEGGMSDACVSLYAPLRDGIAIPTDPYSRIVVGQLDGVAYLIGIHGHHPVDVLATEPERLRPDRLHRRSVGEQPHRRQGDDPAGGEGRRHARGVGGLDAVHLHGRPYVLDVRGDPGEHPAPSAADEDGVDRLTHALLEYFDG